MNRNVVYGIAAVVAIIALALIFYVPNG